MDWEYELDNVFRKFSIIAYSALKFREFSLLFIIHRPFIKDQHDHKPKLSKLKCVLKITSKLSKQCYRIGGKR
jgi:hypothetical protein